MYRSFGGCIDETPTRTTTHKGAKKGRWRYRDMDDVKYGIDANGQ